MTVRDLERVLQHYTTKGALKSRSTSDDDEAKLRATMMHHTSLHKTVRAGIFHLFSEDYVKTHTASGKRAHSSHQVFPPLNEIKFNKIVSVARDLFPGTTRSHVVHKYQQIRKEVLKPPKQPK